MCHLCYLLIFKGMGRGLRHDAPYLDVLLFFVTCNVVYCTCFFENNLEDISPFCGATDTPFWTSSDVSSGFQSQSESSFLYAPLPACNRFLRFTPNVTSRWPTWQLSHFHPHTCTQVLVGLESRNKHAAASRHVTRQMFFRLSYADSALSTVLTFEV